MPIPQDDRIAFSLQIVGAEQQARGLDAAKASLQVEAGKIQKLDTANKHLFEPINVLVNQYQSELEKLDGIARTTITEQDIQDAGSKIIQNHFFPNDLSITVPSLVPYRNVWSKVKPFALTYAIGKTYVETYVGSVQKEADLIQAVLTLIASASTYVDIENTSGQHCTNPGGTCSLPLYTTQASCIAAMPTPGVWTPGIDTIASYPAVQTLKTNLVTAVNNLISFINTEIPTIVTTDPITANQSQNNAAISNINTVIKPALNTWLAYDDFHTVPGSVTTCVGFYSYNPSLLAPTKLHSTELTDLQNALNARLSFISTRVSQLNSILGSISQDLVTGELNSFSGYYGTRYNFMTLRLNALGGSLTQLIGLNLASSAQDSIKANILSTKATYFSILPTSMFKANANGSSTIHVIDSSFLSPGDTVYVYAENQEELKRAVKSIAGDMVVLNDVIPAKYRTFEKARIYKDIT